MTLRQMPRTTQQQGERRSVVRYRTEIPVTFHWGFYGGDLSHGQGFTRDISVLGAYVFSEVCPPINAFVNVDILLPRSLKTGARMSARMRVVRVDDGSGEHQAGFSVAGQNFALLGASQPRLIHFTPKATKRFNERTAMN